MSTGTLVLILTNGSFTTVHVGDKKGPPLETLQRLVGGYIERVKVRYNDRVRDAYVNEDGILKGLSYNETATRLLDGIWKGARIVGPMVVWVPDPKEKRT